MIATSVAPVPFSSAEPIKKSITLLILLCLSVVILSSSVRFAQSSRWNEVEHTVAGERVQSGPDAYFYILEAEGRSLAEPTAIAHLLSFVSTISGFSIDTVAFWIPAVLAAFAGIPTVFLLWYLHRPWAGLLAGVLTSIHIPYLSRTSLGSCDNDMLSLLGASGTAAGLFFLLLPACHQGIRHFQEDSFYTKEWTLFAASLGGWLIGTWVVLQVWLYPSLRPVLIALVIWALFCGCILAKKEQRIRVIFALSLALAIIFVRHWGVVIFAALPALVFWQANLVEKKGKGQYLLYISLGLLAVGLFIDGSDTLHRLFRTMIFYSRNEGIFGGARISIADNYAFISELTPLPLAAFVARIAGNWFMLGVAGVGLFLALLRFPLFCVYLPLVGVSIVSLFWGQRFAMYALPFSTLGISWCIFWFFGTRWPWLRTSVLIICTLVLTGLYANVKNLEIPRLDPSLQYAQAFAAIKEATPPKGLIWMWWDDGGAVQYFSGKAVTVDGHLNNGFFLMIPLRSLSTASLAQSSRIMRWAGAVNTPFPLRKTTVNKPPIQHYTSATQFYGYLQEMQRLGGAGMMTLFDELMYTEPVLPEGANTDPQYIATMWQYMYLLDKISHFGTWNLETGGNEIFYANWYEAREYRLTDEGVEFPNGEKASFRKLIILRADGTQERREWNGEGKEPTHYALINEAASTLMILSKNGFESTAVQLLIMEQGETPYFDLIVDKSPWFKLWQAKEPAKEIAVEEMPVEESRVEEINSTEE